jgi:hypothetical protein
MQGYTNGHEVLCSRPCLQGCDAFYKPRDFEAGEEDLQEIPLWRLLWIFILGWSESGFLNPNHGLDSSKVLWEVLCLLFASINML